MSDGKRTGADQVGRTLLRGAGLRATTARLAVLETLRGARGPLSHGDVVAALADRSFDRATIYRNLIDLVRAGLATRSDPGDRVWRFALAGEGRHRGDRHPHFVCTECGRVQCLTDTRVRLLSGDEGPLALRRDEVEIEIRGCCDACGWEGGRG